MVCTLMFFTRSFPSDNVGIDINEI